jgi:AAA ATPase domain
MHLTGVRIRNYRTVSAEQFVDLTNGLTLVGPNNAGKTNILTAIRMLFTGYDNIYRYERAHDLTFGQRSGQTSLVGIFTGDKDGNDKSIYEQLAELKGLLEIDESNENEEIHLYLTFSTSSNPSYRFFPNTKRPTENTQKAAYSRKERDLVAKLLAGFVCHYVPSNKSFEQLYDDLLIPFIKRHVANALEDKITEIESSLYTTATSLTDALRASGLLDVSVKFDIPNKKLTDLLSGFEFKLLDPNETTLFKKGVGIQSTAILSSFDWITQKELENNLEVVWLIEEPEAFLHPTLNEVCRKLLYRLQTKCLVVITTHSLSFVPQDPKYTAGVTMEDGKTIVRTYKTYKESTAAIRNAIGVRFSDFFNFGRYNILVEGQSDREYFEWAIKRIPSASPYEWLLLRSSDCNFLDFGGVKHLAGFLRATWEFIRNETCAVSVFDGDAAGEKERRDLQQYFGAKQIPFQPNEDFISVRRDFPIEALFPDNWIKDTYQLHPGWFENFSIDASEQLESFKLKNGTKSSFAKYMMGRADAEESLDWAKRWIDVCSAIDKALLWREDKIQADKKSLSTPESATN